MSFLKLEEYEGIATVSRARASNISTIIVSAVHGLITADTVTISGLGGTGYNGTDVVVTVVDSVTFTYANTGSNEGVTGDTDGLVFFNFTLPYNPKTIEFLTTKFLEQTNIPYAFARLGFASPIKSPINVTLNGHFDSTNKNLNYRSLVRKVNKPIMVKLSFENSHDKFYLVTGVNIQKVPTGNRPMHVDYVASFISPFGVLFSATQKSGSKTANDENVGDIVTPIEKITGSVNSGAAVTIRDKDGNGFTFTPDATGTMTYELIKIVDVGGGIKFTEYAYVTVGSNVQIIKIATTTGDLFLKLNPAQSLNDIFTGGTVSGITPTFYFRDGWASD